MRRPSYLYRNIRSGELLELFFVAALSSLLLNRFFLFLTGYPSIGGSRFHIAHMLWGGMLMLAGLIILFSFIGQRASRLAALLSGVGFGLFIDELGKFITRDNNYFFRPTIALLYLIFVVLFFIFRRLAQSRQLTQQEYLLNAIMLTEEAVILDLDEPERQQILEYLRQSDQNHPLTKPLTKAIQGTSTTGNDRQLLRVWTDWLERTYRRFVLSRWGVTVIDIIFITKAVAFVLLIGYGVLLATFKTDIGPVLWASWAQLISTSVSAAFVLIGVFNIRRSRPRAYEWFMRATLIDLFITQFFAFYLRQFGALPDFTLNLLLYIALVFLIEQERRSFGADTASATTAQDPAPASKVADGSTDLE